MITIQFKLFFEYIIYIICWIHDICSILLQYSILSELVVSSVRSSSVYHGLLQKASFQIFHILQILKSLKAGIDKSQKCSLCWVFSALQNLKNFKNQKKWLRCGYVIAHDKHQNWILSIRLYFTSTHAFLLPMIRKTDSFSRFDF